MEKISMMKKINEEDKKKINTEDEDFTHRHFEAPTHAPSHCH